MKRRLLKTGAILMALCTIITASSLTASAKTLVIKRSGDTLYYTDGTERLGIKSIKSDGTLFYDCTHCEDKKVTTNFLIDMLSTQSAYQNIEADSDTKINLLKDWADIASAVFQSGGKYTCTHNYSDYYGKNHQRKYNDQCDVAKLLATKNSVSNGALKHDNYQSTGLTVGSSFSEVRNKMCKEISDRINRYTLDPQDILGQGNCPDALPELADNTKREIIYNIVTSISQADGTCKYQYNSYGLAFYDFETKIIDDGNVDFIEDVSKTKKDSTVEKSILNTTANQTFMDANASITTEVSKSETISTSMSNSESNSYSEMFGGQFMIGYDSFFRGVIEASMTFGQVYESVRSKETTEVSGISETKTVDYSVPAHTIVNVEQSVCTDTMTVHYSTPVAITFKVAVFSMSGDVYADSVATLGINTAGYVQSNFSTFFGGDTETEGLYAYDALANKVDNADTKGWDATYGNNHFFYKKHGGAAATNTTEMDLNWNNIIKVYDTNKNITGGLKEFSNKCPMLPVGTTTTTSVESINTTLSSPIPMFLPASFKITSSDQKSYYLFTDGVFNLGTISVGAFDSDGAPYYDFVPFDGQWEVKEGSEDVIEYDPTTYTVKAKGTGVGYLVWSLKDGVEYTAAYENGSVTNADNKTIEIAFVVRDYPLDNLQN